MLGRAAHRPAAVQRDVRGVCAGREDPLRDPASRCKYVRSLNRCTFDLIRWHPTPRWSTSRATRFSCRPPPHRSRLAPVARSQGWPRPTWSSTRAGYGMFDIILGPVPTHFSALKRLDARRAALHFVPSLVGCLLVLVIRCCDQFTSSGQFKSPEAVGRPARRRGRHGGWLLAVQCLRRHFGPFHTHTHPPSQSVTSFWTVFPIWS